MKKLVTYILARMIMSLPGHGATTSSAAEPQREQLPEGVKPISYDLLLFPDATNLRFHGHVEIALDVTAPVTKIVLNEDELTLDKVALDKKVAPTDVTLDAKLQRASLTFRQPLTTGTHKLTIDYHGVIGTSTVGFFAMDYNSAAGKRRTVVTNFEPTAERRFMPSWDEPGIKAALSLTVDIPADRMAIANMPALSTETLSDGRNLVHFASTPKMSTYLYFLAVGDFERVTAKSDNTEIGIVVSRGDVEKGRYALAEASKLLHYYDDYFGVPYPLPKLDLVLAPGSITGGAMENWGAICYSQGLLLFDPAQSTESDRQRVFSAVSHEMAHQWFGDLVTMAWWDDLWLNEGFASWMQTKAAENLHPEWKTGLQALAFAEQGKRADSKPSTHPIVQHITDASQAQQAFDEITYFKGASVIGMLEAYVGTDAFRNGVRRYMRAHAYGNTVDADFWNQVQAAAGKPLLEMERDFTLQPGLPLIRIETQNMDGGPEKVVISQGRFAEDPSTLRSSPPQQWHIPVAASASGPALSYVLSGTTPTAIPVPGKGSVLVNAGQTTYARVLYPNSTLISLTSTIGTATAVDQLGLLYDSWALGQSGYEPVTNYLEMVRAIPASADPVVWLQVVSTLVSIERFYPEGPGRVAFLSFGRNTLRPLATRLGWDAIPNEEVNAVVLRDNVLKALCRFGDQEVISEARQRFEAQLKNTGSIPPAARRTAIAIMAYSADAEMLNRLLGMATSTHDQLEKQNLFEALSNVADPAGVEKVVNAGIGVDGPAGFPQYLFLALSTDHPDLVWKLAIQHIDQPNFPISPQFRLRLMPYIAANSMDRKRIVDLKAYADEHFPVTARRSVEAAIASINLNATFRDERIPDIDKWLAGRVDK